MTKTTAQRPCPARRADAGFTLVETMMALIILVIMASIVTMGLPTAFDTYQKAVRGSNAQILLSTTSTLLRDEFGLAQDIKVKNDVVYYQSEDGYWASIDKANDTSGVSDSIVKRVYAGSFSNIPSSEVEGSPYALLSDAAITDDLGITYESISYDDGVVTVNDLKVVDAQGNVLASTGSKAGDDLKIRVSLVKEE